MSAVPSGEKVLFDGSPSALVVATHIVWRALVAIGVWLLYGLGLPKVMPLLAEQAGSAGMTPEQFELSVGWIDRVAFWVALVIAAGFAWRAIVGGLRLVVTRYTITERRVQVGTGLLNRNIENLEIARIADVSAQQPLLLRVFGQGNLLVMSSDRSAPYLRLVGLPKPEALMGALLRQAQPANVFEVR